MNAIVPAYDYGAEGIQFEVALTRILGLVAEKLGVEVVPLAACVGRVSAAPQQARLELPGFDQSAMDGYAVCHADLQPGACLAVAGRTAAGEAPGRLDPNSAHRTSLPGRPYLPVPTRSSRKKTSAKRTPVCGSEQCLRFVAGAGVRPPP